jgi:DNA-directed RNA polymerase specialized sigma24 family protein
VVALHYLLGMPLPEVATSLGIPYGTAKSRLHYALTAMRVGVQADAYQAAAAIPEGQLA